MEAERSNPLPAAKWRTRKGDDVIQLESEGLRTSSSDVRQRWIFQLKKREKNCPHSQFCSIQLSMD